MLETWGSGLRQPVMIIAISLVLHAQLTLRRANTDVTAWLELAAGALLAALIAGPAPRRAPATPQPPTRLGRGRAVLALLALVPVAATTFLAATRRMPVLGMALWVAAPLLASLALRGWRATPARRTPHAWPRGEMRALLIILVVGGLARTLWIGSHPRAYFGDEPRVAMFLNNFLLHGNPTSFFVMGWNTWPVIGLMLQGLFVPLFDLHIWTLRLSSALMGTLAILTTYLLARELFSRRVALLAAFLFAICRTAIDFSRLGITHAQILFIEPLALFLWWRATATGQAVTYLWAGVATGWCLFSYNAGQLVPVLLLGWIGLVAVLARDRVRTHWRGVALVAAGFAITVFPYVFYFTDAFTFDRNWQQWTIMARDRQIVSRITEAWQASGAGAAWDLLLQQIRLTWLGFGVIPGGGYAIGYRGGGMLDDVSAALFVTGLAVAVRRVREAAYGFVLYWWLLTAVAGSVVTGSPPSFVRMIGIVPAVAMLAAQPLGWLMRSGRAAISRTIGTLAAIALLVAATWQNYQTYFVEYAATAADPISELVRYVESLPDNVRVAVLGAEHHLQIDGELSRIEFPGRGRDIAEAAHFLPIHEPIDAPLAIIFTPSQMTLAPYAQALYPSAIVQTPLTGAGTPSLFRSVIVTPEAARERTGLSVRAKHPDETTTDLGVLDPFATRLELPPNADRLFWTGRVYWPSPRPLQVTVTAKQPSTVRIGDALPIVADGLHPSTATVALPRGWQPVEIVEAAAPQRELSISIAGPEVREQLSRWDFRPESTAEGLIATYVLADGTSVRAIDPQLNAFAVEDRFPASSNPLVRMPFRATWRGALKIDTAGDYEFEAVGSGPFQVELDGSVLVADAPEHPENPKKATARRTLSPGLHPIVVAFDSTVPAHTTRRMFQLFWTPPGGEQVLVPPTAFVPES